MLAVGQAFLDTRRTGRTGLLGIVGVVVIAVFVIAPHLAVYRYGTVLGGTFERVFSGAVLGASDDPDAGAGPAPRDDERLNVLLVGVDKRAKRLDEPDRHDDRRLARPGRAHRLVVSVPRDLVDMPLGNGDIYGPKLNSLLSYADAHPERVPRTAACGPCRTPSAHCSGSPSTTTAQVDFGGFVGWSTPSAASTSPSREAFDDPNYDGYGVGDRG